MANRIEIKKVDENILIWLGNKTDELNTNRSDLIKSYIEEKIEKEKEKIKVVFNFQQTLIFKDQIDILAILHDVIAKLKEKYKNSSIFYDINGFHCLDFQKNNFKFKFNSLFENINVENSTFNEYNKGNVHFIGKNCLNFALFDGILKYFETKSEENGQKYDKILMIFFTYYGDAVLEKVVNIDKNIGNYMEKLENDNKIVVFGTDLWVNSSECDINYRNFYTKTYFRSEYGIELLKKDIELEVSAFLNG